MAILVIREILRFLKSRIFRNILARLKPPAAPSRPRMMKPKSEKDCPYCMAEKAAGDHLNGSCSHQPISWRQRKGRGGRKKRIATQGYACPNLKCEYFGITDEQIHTLMGYGSHGKKEAILDFCCQSISTAGEIKPEASTRSMESWLLYEFFPARLFCIRAIMK